MAVNFEESNRDKFVSSLAGSTNTNAGVSFSESAKQRGDNSMVYSNQDIGKAYTQRVSPTYNQVGATPTSSQVMTMIGNAYKAGNTTEAQKYLNDYIGFMSDKSSPYYQPYATSATNSSVLANISQLTGIDFSGGITADQLTQLDKYADYSNLNVDGTSPKNGGTAAQQLAYWLHKAKADEETTQRAETELNDMYAQVAYLVSRGYSDDYIRSHVSFENYATLNKAIANTTTAGAVPSTFNRPINLYGSDTVAGMINAARNGGEYKGFSDVMSFYGNGSGYQKNTTEEAKRNSLDSNTYHPFSFGASDNTKMHTFCKKYGIKEFDRDWLDKNEAKLKANGDYAFAYDAVQTYEECKRDLDKLNGLIDKWVDEGKTVEQIMTNVNNNITNVYSSTLGKMEESRVQGSAISLSGSVDFAIPYVQKQVEQKVKEREEKVEAANKEKLNAEYVPDKMENWVRYAILSAEDGGIDEEGYATRLVKSDEIMKYMDAHPELKYDFTKAKDKAYNSQYKANIENHIGVVQNNKIVADQAKADAEARAVQANPDFNPAAFTASLQNMNEKEAADTLYSFTDGIAKQLNGRPTADADAKAFFENYSVYFSGAKFGYFTADDGIGSDYRKYDERTNYFGESVAKVMADVDDAHRDGLISDKTYVEYLLGVASIAENLETPSQISELFDAENKEVIEAVSGIERQIAHTKQRREEDRLSQGRAGVQMLNEITTNGGKLDEGYQAIYDKYLETDVSMSNDAGYLDALRYSRAAVYGNGTTAPFDSGAEMEYDSTKSIVNAAAQTAVINVMKEAATFGITFNQAMEALGYDMSDEDKAYASVMSLIDKRVNESYGAVDEISRNVDTVTNALINSFDFDTIDNVAGYNADSGLSRDWFDDLVVDLVDEGTVSQDEADSFLSFYKNADANTRDALYQDIQERYDGKVNTDEAKNILYRTLEDQSNAQLERFKNGSSEQLVAQGDGSMSEFDVIGLGIQNGLQIHGKNVAGVAYAMFRKDAEGTETYARTNFTREQYRDAVIASIDGVDDPTLKAMLMDEFANYNGDIYDFKVDIGSLAIKDYMARREAKSKAITAEAAANMSEKEFWRFNAYTTATNSTLTSIETAVSIQLLTAAGCPEPVAKYLATTMVTGSMEGSEVTNTLMDNGVSKSNATAMGALNGFIAGSAEALLDGYINKFTCKVAGGTSADAIFDFNSAGKAALMSQWMMDKTGKKGLAAASYILTKMVTDTFQNVANNAITEPIEEGLQDLSGQLTEAWGYQLNGIDTGKKAVDFRDTWNTMKDTFKSTFIMEFGSTLGAGVSNTVTYNTLGRLGENRGKIQGFWNPFSNIISEFKSADAYTKERDNIITNTESGIGASQTEAINEIEAANAEYEQAMATPAPSYEDWCQGMFDEAQHDIYVGELYSDKLLELQNSNEKVAVDEAQATLEAAQAELKEAVEQDAKNQELFDSELAELNAEAIPGDDLIERFNKASNLRNVSERRVAEARSNAEAAQAQYDTARTAYNGLMQTAYREAVSGADELILKRKQERIAHAMEVDAQNRETLKRAAFIRLNRLREASFDENGNGTLRGVLSGFNDASAITEANETLNAYAENDVNIRMGLANILKKAFYGWDVVYTDLGDIANANVDKTNHVISINSNLSEQELFTGILQHELTHIAEMSGKYSEFASAVLTQFFGKSESKDEYTTKSYQKALADLQERYGKAGVTLDEKGAINELVAECVKELFNNNKLNAKQFIDTLIKYAGQDFTGDILSFLLKQSEAIREQNKGVKWFRSKLKQQQSAYANLVKSFTEVLEDVSKQTSEEVSNEPVKKPEDNPEYGTVPSEDMDISTAEDVVETPVSEDVEQPSAENEEYTENENPVEPVDILFPDTEPTVGETPEKTYYGEADTDEDVAKIVDGISNGTAGLNPSLYPQLVYDEENNEYIPTSDVTNENVGKVLEAVKNADLEEEYLYALNGNVPTMTVMGASVNAPEIAEQSKREEQKQEYIENGAAPEVADIMIQADYQKPTKGDADTQYSIRTLDDSRAAINVLAQSYTGDSDLTARATESGKLLMYLSERVLNDPMLRDFVKHGLGADKGGESRAPLRKNTGGYIVTFDLDANCPRTYEYGSFRDKVQETLGRKLSSDETYSLIMNMRARGLMIPCTYCYVENKRIALDQAYNDYITNRSNAITGTTDEEMYKNLPKSVYNPKKGGFTKAGQTWKGRFERFVAQKENAYNPTLNELFHAVNESQAAVYNFLDEKYNKPENWVTDESTARTLSDGTKLKGYSDFVLPKGANIVKDVCEYAGIEFLTEKSSSAQKELADMAASWLYDLQTNTPHNIAAENQEATEINIPALELHREAMNYAHSSSQAKNKDNYAPYSDQIMAVTVDEKKLINAHGGLRIHSSNDFMLDNLVDYIQLITTVAADKRGGFGFMSHEYTKDLVGAKVFSRTGIRQNISVAYYGGDKGNPTVTKNLEEGADIDKAYELAKESPDIGIMAMVTNDAQLSEALNDERVNMIIPFHSSGMPKELWYNLLKWQDYSSKQNDKLKGSGDMRKELANDGVKLEKGLTPAQVQKLYDEHFGVVRVFYHQEGDGSWTKTDEQAQVHILPGDQYITGEGIDTTGMSRDEMIEAGLLIPGHNNDVQTYLAICQKFGIKPRFSGTKVYDASLGKNVDITEHSQYLKVLKETARTDSEQREVTADFGENNELIEYGINEMTKAAKAKGGYNAVGNDKSMVDDFVANVVGKKRPAGWISLDSAIQYFSSNEEAFNMLADMREEGKVEGFTYPEFIEMQGKYPVTKVEQAPASQRVFGVEPDAQFDSQYSVNSSKRKSLFDSLMEAMSIVAQEALDRGDKKTYRQTMGRMFGALNAGKYEKGTPVTSPLNALRLLATDVGSHIAEGINSIDPEDSNYDDWSNGVLLDSLTNKTFNGVLRNVGNTVAKQAGTTDDPDFINAFGKFMTTPDAILQSNAGLWNYIQQFRTKMENGTKEQQALMTILDKRRTQMVHYLAASVSDKIDAYVASKSRIPKNSSVIGGNGTIKDTIRTILYKAVDDSVVAEVVDNIAGSHLLQNTYLYQSSFGIRKAERVLNGSRFLDVNGHTVRNAKTLAQGMKEAGVTQEDYQELNKYLVAKAAIDRAEMTDEKGNLIGQEAFNAGEEINPEVFGSTVAPSVEQLKAYVAGVESDPSMRNIVKGAEAFWQFGRDFMNNYVVKAGLLDADVYAEWQRRMPHYASLKRYMGDMENFMTTVKGNAHGLQFAKYVGMSNRTVINPIESMADAVHTMVKACSFNVVKQAFAEQYAKTKNMSSIAQELTAAEATGYVADADKQGEPVYGKVTTPNTIVVDYADGKKKYFQIYNNELFNLLSGANQHHVKQATESLGRLTRFMTKMTTGVNMLFAGKNAIRDFQHSVNYGSWASNYVSGFFKWASAFVDVTKEMAFGLEKGSQQIKDYIDMGGGEWERMNTGNASSIKEFKMDVFGKSGWQTAKGVVKEALTWETLNTIIETTSRFAEYKYGKNATGTNDILSRATNAVRGMIGKEQSNGTVTDESKQKAFMAAQEATVNFQRHGTGATVDFLKTIVPFFNATLQGIYQDSRLIFQSKDNFEGKRRIIAKTVINNMLSGIFSAAAFLCFLPEEPEDEELKGKDAERKSLAQKYLELQDGLKESYILLPARLFGKEDKDGNFAMPVFLGGRDTARLPVSNGMLEHLFYNYGRQLVEDLYLGKDVSGMGSDVLRLAFSSIGSNVLDFTTIMSPVIDVATNTTWYGGDLVSASTAKNADVAEWYKGDTTGLAQVSSKITNWFMDMVGIDEDSGIRQYTSPIALDYLAQQYTGIIGQMLVPLLSKNKYTGEANAKHFLATIGDVAMKSYTLDMDASSSLSEAVSDGIDKMESIIGTVDKQGDYSRYLNPMLTDEQATEAYEEAKKLTSKGGVLYENEKAISALWKDWYAIMNGKDDYGELPLKQREILAESVYEQMAEINRQSVQVIGAYEEKYCGNHKFINQFGTLNRSIKTLTDTQRAITGLEDRYQIDLDNGAEYMKTAQRLYDANPGYSSLLPSPNFSTSTYKVLPEYQQEFSDIYYQTYSAYAESIVSSLDGLSNEEQVKLWQNVNTKAQTAAKNWYKSLGLDLDSTLKS